MTGHRFPPTGAIRQAWIDSHPFRASTPVEEREAEFDRWLAAHDREVAAQALRDAAAAIDGERRHDLDKMATLVGTRDFWETVAVGKERAAVLLRDRADRMARAER